MGSVALMRRILIAPLALAVFAFGLSACGGGDDKLSKSALAKKANIICSDFDDKVQAHPPPADAGKKVAYYSTTLPQIVTGLADKLRELKPADDVKADWNALVAKFDGLSPILKEIASATKVHDRAALQAQIQRFRTLQTSTDQIGKRLGATKCASPG